MSAEKIQPTKRTTILRRGSTRSFATNYDDMTLTLAIGTLQAEMRTKIGRYEVLAVLCN